MLFEKARALIFNLQPLFRRYILEAYDILSERPVNTTKADTLTAHFVDDMRFGRVSRVYILKLCCLTLQTNDLIHLEDQWSI